MNCLCVNRSDDCFFFCFISSCVLFPSENRKPVWRSTYSFQSLFTIVVVFFVLWYNFTLAISVSRFRSCSLSLLLRISPKIFIPCTLKVGVLLYTPLWPQYTFIRPIETVLRHHIFSDQYFPCAHTQTHTALALCTHRECVCAAWKALFIAFSLIFTSNAARSSTKSACSFNQRQLNK